MDLQTHILLPSTLAKEISNRPFNLKKLHILKRWQKERYRKKESRDAGTFILLYQNTLNEI